MWHYILADKYGYWSTVTAESANEAVRIASGLSRDANLEYADHSFIAEIDQISDKEYAMHNCEIA